MIEGIISNIQYLDKDFVIKTHDNCQDGHFIETDIFNKDHLIFSRKTSYGHLQKNYSNAQKLEQRLTSILKSQHNIVLKGLMEGEYNNLLGIGEKFNQSESLQTDKSGKISLEQINLSLNNLKKILATSLLATYFWDSEGNEIAGYTILPKDSKMFNQISNKLQQTLNNQEFPTLGKHYVLDMVDDYLMALIPMNTYHWGLLIDTKKIQFDTLMTTIIPNVIKSFEKIFYN